MNKAAARYQLQAAPGVAIFVLHVIAGWTIGYINERFGKYFTGLDFAWLGQHGCILSYRLCAFIKCKNRFKISRVAIDNMADFITPVRDTVVISGL